MSGLSASICDDLPVIYSYQLLILVKKYFLSVFYSYGRHHCCRRCENTSLLVN